MSARRLSVFRNCLICCEPSEYFCVGLCDHPICFVCSIRMRVVCDTKECPVCRRELEEIFMLSDPLKYREVNHKSFDWNDPLGKKYGYKFEVQDATNRFYDVLAHICPICKDEPEFKTFRLLEEHMRRKHEQFYCDLCIDNLKLFSWERRSYTRPELAHHRRNGDADDRSHRGHPSCEFCDVRYFDDDMLFRHLRRDHYFCHFCEADGVNQFYDDYEALKGHFRDKHFLCEEGRCKDEQFIGAFRHELDFKAHKATIHGKDMKPGQLKQERVLNVELNYDRYAGSGSSRFADGALRGCSRGGRGGGGPPRRDRMPYEGRGSDSGHTASADTRGRGTRAGLRSSGLRRGHTNTAGGGDATNDPQLQAAIDASLNADGLKNRRPAVKPAPEFKVENQEAEFPTLELDPNSMRPKFHGLSAAQQAARWVRENRLVRSGSLDEQEFPSLGVASIGSSQAQRPYAGQRNNAKTQTAQATQKKKPSGIRIIDDDEAFPSLGSSGNRPASTEPVFSGTAVTSSLSEISASFRRQAGDAKSQQNTRCVAAPPAYAATFHAGEAQQEELPGLSSNAGAKAKTMPVAKDTVTHQHGSSWSKTSNAQAQQSQQESKKPKAEKVLPKSAADSAQSSSAKQLSVFAAPVPVTAIKQPRSGPVNNMGAFETVGSKPGHKVEMRTGNSRTSSFSEAPASTCPNSVDVGPPPGFSHPAAVAPPPGFGPPPGFTHPRFAIAQHVGAPLVNKTVSHHADAISGGLISNGHIANGGRNNSPAYLKPTDFDRRNNKLFGRVESLLQPDRLIEFKVASGKYRGGELDDCAYVKLILQLFGKESSLLVLPELICLLPDITKQGALLIACANASLESRDDKSNLSGSSSGWKTDQSGTSSTSKGLPPAEASAACGRLLTFLRLEQCQICGQIVLHSEYKRHKSEHAIDAEFPSL